MAGATIGLNSINKFNVVDNQEYVYIPDFIYIYIRSAEAYVRDKISAKLKAISMIPRYRGLNQIYA